MIPKRRFPRPGITIIEMLITLSLLLVIAPVISETFRSILYVYRTTEQTHTNVRSYESATDRLRQDAWSATKIDIINPQTVEITSPTGKLTWTIDTDGVMIRTPANDQPTRWQQAGKNLLFNNDSTTLLLTEPHEDPALATRFFSPIAQQGGQPK